MLRSLSLWGHQRKAVGLVIKYLAAFRRGKTNGAALIHMPTGTGKTGVIASLARCIPEIDCVLVVAPRVALRDQLWRDISGRFFTRLERKPKTLPKTVVRLDDSGQSTKNLSDLVLVTTIQKLDSMKKRSEDLYARLQANTSLLIFDEGHYEPALVWREAVRGIPSPRVIFTATPYRNDLKLFDVDTDYVYSYTFADALQERFVRRIELLPVKATRSPQEFISQVLSAYDKYLNPRRPGGAAPRAIIRCDSPESIRQISAGLREAGRTFVAIHEQFSNDNVSSNERRSVPDPDKTDATFWVHQFKLLEGIDDPRFQLLALYDELRTVRPFVQQVGRILRNPARKGNNIAYLVDGSNGRQAALWKNYLEYDQFIKKNGVAKLALGQQELVESLQKAHPPLVYVDGRFRSPANLETLNAWDDLQLPLTVNVFKKNPSFQLADTYQSIVQVHTEADRIVYQQPMRDSVGVIFYVTFRNSPYLREQVFFDCRLGLTVVRELDNYVCYFDSSGTISPQIAGLGSSVPAKTLRKLFQRRPHCYLTSVSLKNANIGASVIRARSVSAVDIDATAPSFDDHAFVWTMVYGYSHRRSPTANGKNRVRRYLGIGHGRISDFVGKFQPLQEYLDWLDEIADIMSGNAQPLLTFRRYADTADPPPDPIALSVLLDVADIQDRYLTSVGSGVVPDQPMHIDELCRDVENGKFSLSANGTLCWIDINFDDDRRRYSLSSPELDALYYSTDTEEREGLIQYLNRTQSLGVIPRSPGVFYTLGEFYRPLIQFGPQYDDGKTTLLASLVPVEKLGSIGSEKGSKCKPSGTGWEKGCVFDLIDKLGAGSKLATYLDGTVNLVCDDMGDELADFLAIRDPGRRNPRKQLIFIHAKAKPQASLYSASDLQDVCAQAVKNLGELALFGESRSIKVKKWGEEWKSGQVKGRVNRRIRCGPRPEKVWEELRRLVRDPNADRQVWIVVGQILSKERFEQELKKAQPAAAAVQAAYLLFSTMTTVAAAGARLQVFCSP